MQESWEESLIYLIVDQSGRPHSPSITADIRRAIHDRSRAALEKALAATAFRPLREDYSDLVRDGVTTVEEVLHTIGRREA